MENRVAERLAKVHPNAKRKVRPDAKYVSAKLQEFIIDRDDLGYYYIRLYKGGRLHESLQGRFISFADCERRLIARLEATDKFGGRAIWPKQKQ